MVYEISFDNGKPYTEKFNSLAEVEVALKKFYKENKDDDYPFNALVYEDGFDITDSFPMEQMISAIIDEVENETKK